MAESSWNPEPEEESAAGGAELAVGWFWPVVGLAAFLSLPYYFSIETFFSHDDFAILHFHKNWPVWEPWLFLRTDVLTFYRPLQSYLLGFLYQLFGMNAFPYNIVLIGIHIVNVVLLGRLVDRLFDDRPLTLLAVIFYAADWEYCDVVFWKGNYGTALSWLFALGAANGFVDRLRGAGWRRYAVALLSTAAALLSKETAVDVPLLLSLIYCARPPDSSNVGDEAAGQTPAGADRRRSRPPMDWVGRLREFARVLWPFYGLVAAYGAFHHWAVRDVYNWLPKGYEVQGIRGATGAVFHAMTFWLTPFLEAGASSLSAGAGPSALSLWLDRHPYLLPALLIVVVAALRNRRMAFGALWAVLAFFPANWIPDYHTPRYYYGAIMGIAIVFAEMFLAADHAIRVRRRFGEVAAARVVGSLLILAFIYSNLIYTTTLVTNDARKSREIEDLYHFLVLQREKVPPRTLFRVRCLNQQDHFHQGFGLREMFKLALDEDSVEAILPDERLTDEVRGFLLTKYSKPVELLREPDGRFRLLIQVPTTATVTQEK